MRNRADGIQFHPIPLDSIAAESSGNYPTTRRRRRQQTGCGGLKLMLTSRLEWGMLAAATELNVSGLVTCFPPIRSPFHRHLAQAGIGSAINRSANNHGERFFTCKLQSRLKHMDSARETKQTNKQADKQTSFNASLCPLAYLNHRHHPC